MLYLFDVTIIKPSSYPHVDVLDKRFYMWSLGNFLN